MVTGLCREQPGTMLKTGILYEEREVPKWPINTQHLTEYLQRFVLLIVVTDFINHRKYAGKGRINKQRMYVGAMAAEICLNSL